MTWAKLDDQFWHNRKTRRAGSSVAVWAICLSWSNAELTDGHIPAADIDFICSGITNPELDAQKLAEVGMFDTVDDGWVIHDFGEFNESRESVESRRRADRKRKAKGGRASPPSNRIPDGIQTESRRNPAGTTPQTPQNGAPETGPSPTEQPPKPFQPDSKRNPDGIQAESGSPDPTRPDPTYPESDSSVQPTKEGLIHRSANGEGSIADQTTSRLLRSLGYDTTHRTPQLAAHVTACIKAGHHPDTIVEVGARSVTADDPLTHCAEILTGLRTDEPRPRVPEFTGHDLPDVDVNGAKAARQALTHRPNLKAVE